jgi:uncharacterized protein
MITAWNGIALSSFAEAACVLGRKEYLDAAICNAEFLTDKMFTDGRLRHSLAKGRTGVEAFLQDYAFLIEGFLLLHKVTFEGRWLKRAIDFTEIIRKEFLDERRVQLYDVGENQQELFLRPGSITDSPIPSGASAAVMQFFKINHITDDDRLAGLASGLVKKMTGIMQENPLATANWLNVVDFYLSSPIEAVTLGNRESPQTQMLLQTLCERYIPNSVMVAFDPHDPGALPQVALLQDKSSIDGRTIVYICQGYSCREPVTEPEALKQVLQRLS